MLPLLRICSAVGLALRSARSSCWRRRFSASLSLAFSGCRLSALPSAGLVSDLRGLVSRGVSVSVLSPNTGSSIMSGGRRAVSVFLDLSLFALGCSSISAGSVSSRGFWERARGAEATRGSLSSNAGVVRVLSVGLAALAGTLLGSNTSVWLLAAAGCCLLAAGVLKSRSLLWFKVNNTPAMAINAAIEPAIKLNKPLPC